MGPSPLTHLRPLKWADWWALWDYKPSNDCKDLKLAVICPFIAIHKLHWARLDARSFLHILLFSLSILTFFQLQKAYKSIQNCIILCHCPPKANPYSSVLLSCYDSLSLHSSIFSSLQHRSRMMEQSSKPASHFAQCFSDFPSSNIPFFSPNP